MEKIKHLLSALETVTSYGRPETAKWFEKACDEYMTGQEKKSLDICLGLGSTRGKTAARTAYQIEQRNRYIKRAFACIDPDKGPTKRCELLVEQVKAFECRVFPRLKDLEELPPGMSELRKSLWLAKKTGAELSTDLRTIYRWVFDI